MRKATIPQTVELVTQDGSKPYPFVQFGNENVLIDPRLRDEWATSFGPISDFFAADPGTEVELQDQDQERIKTILKAINIAPVHIAKVMPYFHAVTLAKHEKEEKKPDAKRLPNGRSAQA